VGKQIVKERVYTIPGFKNALLCQPAIENVKLLTVGEVESYSSIVCDNPKLFKGLGEMGEYKIELEANAHPFTLLPSRRVAVPLMKKVKAELKRMEKGRIMFKVEQLTDWCERMVVVPKPNSKLRICIDFTKLNHSV